MILKGKNDTMPPKILIPVDDSETAHATIAAIIAQRTRFPEKIDLLYVVNEEQLAYKMIPELQLQMVRENAEKAGLLHLENMADKLEGAGFVVETVLKFGNPTRTITHIANTKNYQLLVIGRQAGSGEIRDVIFGSVANYVLHNVKCPVLLF